MYNVHKYMALSQAEVGYFISQVGLAAASFGVTEDDVKEIEGGLMGRFGYKCSPEKKAGDGDGLGVMKGLQSICTEVCCYSVCYVISVLTSN